MTEPITRDAWVNDFVSEVIRLRPDLAHSFKFATAVAQTEWAMKHKVDPRVAAKQWNERVRSARP